MNIKDLFNAWHREYAKRYDERSYDDIPPVADMEAAYLAGMEAEREACAEIAEQPYGDEVQAFGRDEPKAVGTKIASAIRVRSNPQSKFTHSGDL